MALSSTTITATAVANTLGTSDLRWSALCTSGNINKWSKHKPIKHSSNGPLNAWIGEATESGYYYGLHCSSLANNWVTIHNADYSYAKPTGTIGVAPYRLLDFRSYERGAIPEFYASSDTLVDGGLIIPSDISDDSIFAFALLLERNSSYNGSYSFSPLDGLAGSTVSAASTYLLVAIGDYARVMVNSDDGRVISPIYNGDHYVKTWLCPRVPTSLGYENGVKAQVTIFLSTSYMVSGNDARYNWVPINGLAAGAKAVAMPNGNSTTAGALTALIEFNTSSSSGFGEFSGVVIAQRNNYIVASANMTSAPTITSTYYYKIDICNYSTGRVIATDNSDNITVQAGATLGFPSVSKLITDFLVPTASTTYLIRAYLYGVKGTNTTQLASGEGTFVYTSDN